MRDRWFFAFFVVSGFCALLCQVVWLRLAMARFGVTAAMVAIVLSVFMAGLALGNALGGRIVERFQASTRIVLLLYAAYLRLARTASWRGPRASRLCIFNFVVVILSFTVVNLYLSHSHRYF